MLTGPQPKGAHQRTKFTLDIFKICQKQEKSQILGVLLTGPRDPRYGSEFIAVLLRIWHIMFLVLGVFWQPSNLSVENVLQESNKPNDEDLVD